MLQHRTLLPLAAILFVVIIMSGRGSAESLGPISEETPPATCDPGSFISAIHCAGSYCDNVTISCASFSGAALGDASWSAWVSEEQGPRECPQNHLIAGLTCRGGYCDNLSLYCVEVKNMARGTCGDTTPEVSEEEGGDLSFVSDKAGVRVFARAMKCSGRYCDKKSFSLCEAAIR
jgi:hypothetical protein